MAKPNDLVRALGDAPPAGGWASRREIPFDMPEHLAEGLPEPAFSWHPREGTDAWYGAGAFRAWSDATPEALDAALEDAGAEVRVWGGLAFDPEGERGPEWAGYGGSSFWVPRVEWGRRGGRGFLAVHGDPADAEVRLILEGMARPAPRAVRGEARRTDLPDFEGWRHGVERILGLAAEGRLAKAVLARRTFGGVPHAAGPSPLGRTRFEFRRGGRRFLGASPERLFRRDADLVSTEALAATRRRGKDAAEDDALAASLLESRKDRLEHDLVFRDLAERLKSLAAAVDAGDMDIRRYPTVQHLYAPLSARLHEGVGSATVLHRLHPTPAVGLSPRGASRALLRELEGFDRGWYAGAVGWMRRDAAEFAVAIRSALVDGEAVYRYAGAGIVPGSDAASEWEELNVKLAGVPV